MPRKRRRGRKDWTTLGVTLVRADHRRAEEIAAALDLRPGTMGRSIVLAALGTLAEMRAELGDEHFRSYVTTHGVVRAMENYRRVRPVGSNDLRLLDLEPPPLTGAAAHV